MMSPVPRRVPQDGFDIGVDPLRQPWVLRIEYERRWYVTDIETQQLQHDIKAIFCEKTMVVGLD